MIEKILTVAFFSFLVIIIVSFSSLLAVKFAGIVSELISTLKDGPPEGFVIIDKVKDDSSDNNSKPIPLVTIHPGSIF